MTRVAVLPGDGIGPEVTRSAIATFPESYELTWVGAGAERYLTTGEVLTDQDMTRIAKCDALLFGAIGDPRIPDGILERGILLRLRKELDLYVNVRPFPELDIVIVRENTEGLYAGVGSRRVDLATETSVNTRSVIERCAIYAFELARTRACRLTLVHKRNVLVHAGGLWTEVVDAVSRTYPGVDVHYEHVDASAYHLVNDHRRFDVILTDNLFGDILSDLAAALAGGLGRAASMSLHPDASTRATTCVGMFEPVHGSAPDIVGTGSADPTAAIRAAEMLIRTLTTRNEEAIVK